MDKEESAYALVSSSHHLHEICKEYYFGQITRVDARKIIFKHIRNMLELWSEL